MSCWVVPAIAAELWGTSLDHIQQCIRDGSVASKQEHGFTFIDVAPNSPTLEATITARPNAKPVTFVQAVQIESLDPTNVDEEHVHEEEESRPIVLADWRSSREAAARQRRAPISNAA